MWEDKEFNAYCAGLFDGEGCIHIEKQQYRGQKTRYTLRCKLTMANVTAVNLLAGRFGGSVYKDGWHKNSNRNGKLWTWLCQSIVAKQFLLAIRPYLQVKGTEADLALEFQNKKRSRRNEGERRSRNKSDEDFALEEKQYWEMRELKRR